jgi:predicted nucleic acid-binding Zn ribbon protein
MDSKPCLNCSQPIPPERRADSRHCSDDCRRRYQDRYFAGSRIPTSLVYFLAGEGLIQISLSRHLSTTLRCLRSQQGSLVELRVLAVKDGDTQLLEKIHRRFAHLRRHGRWFEAAPELLEYIRRNARQF